MTPESVSSFERTEDGWLLEVEVLELDVARGELQFSSRLIAAHCAADALNAGCALDRLEALLDSEVVDECDRGRAGEERLEPLGTDLVGRRRVLG